MLQWNWQCVSRTSLSIHLCLGGIVVAEGFHGTMRQETLSTIAPKWSEPGTPPPKVVLPAGNSAPRLAGPQKPLSAGFLANLKDFLAERPVKVSKNAKGAVFTPEAFGTGVAENFKEWFKPTPKAVSSRMTVDWQPTSKVLWQNIRDLISPPKLPPLKVTSQPVKVRDIWTKDKAFGPSQATALAVHIAITLLILSPWLYKTVIKATANPVNSNLLLTPIDISDYAMKLPPGKDKAGGGGGGGAREVQPATKGRAPKFSMTQIAPPMVHTKLDSKFDATLLGPPDLKIPSPNMDTFGDPLAKLVNGSGGPGGGSGIGSGNGTGIGSGEGGGLGPGSGGSTGGGVFRAGTGGVGYPTCFYMPDPKYSEEARKAKYQGVVVLEGTITLDGRVTDIQTVKGPGLGLEEKAVEAVKDWRCKPAMGPNGKPVPTRVPIEVNFRLL
jgi:protein TonB